MALKREILRAQRTALRELPLLSIQDARLAMGMIIDRDSRAAAMDISQGRQGYARLVNVLASCISRGRTTLA